MVAKVKLPTRAKEYDTEPTAARSRFAGPGRGYHFTPSDEQRAVVETMASLGASQRLIASVVVNPDTNKPISEGTLRAAFEAELELGLEKAKMKVAKSLFEAATASPPNITALIWWQKIHGINEHAPIDPEGQGSPQVVVRIMLPPNGRDPEWERKLWGPRVARITDETSSQDGADREGERDEE